MRLSYAVVSVGYEGRLPELVDSHGAALPLGLAHPEAPPDGKRNTLPVQADSHLSSLHGSPPPPPPLSSMAQRR